MSETTFKFIISFTPQFPLYFLWLKLFNEFTFSKNNQNKGVPKFF